MSVQMELLGIPKVDERALHNKWYLIGSYFERSNVRQTKDEHFSFRHWYKKIPSKEVEKRLSGLKSKTT